ncbi:MAG: S1 family peptidase [Candidatus Hodarchaeales archaeon]|jgi:S1-C subfamily serine protease
MKNLLLSLVMVFSVGFTSSISLASTDDNQATNTYKPEKPIEKVAKSLTANERKIRNAAVKVLAGGGHGSGTVVQYKDLTLVFTARHVADGKIGQDYVISKDMETRTGVLVYQSKEHDIAIILLPNEFNYVKPMSWNPASKWEVGTDIVYSGHPSWHKLMSFEGRIVGYEEVEGSGTQIIVNTYGWFGCSGSGVYNTKGQLIGILYGVDVQYTYGTHIQENMIWVAPIKNVNMKDALDAFCRGTIKNYRACR